MDAPALLLCLALVFAVLATPAFLRSSPSSTVAAKPFDAAHAAVRVQAVTRVRPHQQVVDVGAGDRVEHPGQVDAADA